MIKQKSWARLEYEYAYRGLRRGSDYEDMWNSGEHAQSILKAADYSYQAFPYIMCGWINDKRFSRFHAIKWRILTQRGELPF